MYNHAMAQTGRQLADNIAQRLEDAKEEDMLPNMHIHHGDIFEEAIVFIDDLQPEKEEPTTIQRIYLEHLKPSLHKARQTALKLSFLSTL
jgi:hypothetical protein